MRTRKTKYEYDLAYRTKHKEEIKARKHANRAKHAENERARRLKNVEKTRTADKARKTSNRLKYLLNSARRRAKRSGLEFSITEADFPPIGTHCPVLGIEYNQSASHNTKDFSPSLDRLDNSKGYIVGNVQIISWRANRLKSNGTIEELEKIVKHLRSLK
jgi:hypothetical protein